MQINARELTPRNPTGETIFDFMADIKEALEVLMPDAIVTVQPWRKRCVTIRVDWTIPHRGGAERSITVDQIIHAKYDMVDEWIKQFVNSRKRQETERDTRQYPAR